MRRSFLMLVLLWPLAGWSQGGAQDAGSSPPFHTGASLLEWCQMEESAETLLCLGYLAGVSDALEAIVAATGGSSGVCRPRGTTLGRMRDDVIDWAKAHSGLSDRAASVTVISALQDAFPCEPQN